MAQVERKWITWSVENTTSTIEILEPPGGSSKYRIIGAAISGNPDTSLALLHFGDTVPLSGSSDVIDYIDDVRQKNTPPLDAPAFSKSNHALNITVTSKTASTSEGKVLVTFIKEFN